MINAILPPNNQQLYQLPFYSSAVAAGFPSPADDHIEGRLDLNKLLIKHPSATFFMRATGDLMSHAGIHNNDILIIDRSIKPTHGKIVIAAINGQLVIRQIKKTKAGKKYLIAESNNTPPLEIKENDEIDIWGIITNVIHPV